MKRSLGALVATAVVATFALAARPARAQTPSEIAMAKQWFAEGLAREEKADWAGALDLFRRAAQVKRTPQIVYHVGLCESRSGGLVEALVDLDSAATIARTAHADDVVTAAKAELADVKARIPTLDVRISGDAAPARFVVDGSAIALSLLHTPMPLDPGEHTVTIEFSSGASATAKATLAEHDAKMVSLAPAASSPAASAPVAPAGSPASSSAAAEPPASAAVPDSSPRGGSAVPWVLAGVGGAVLAVGAVFFVEARVKEGSLHDACPSRTGCDPSLESSYDTAKTFNAVGLGLGAVGVVGIAAGVTMLGFRTSPSSPASGSALVVGPGRVAWTVRF